MYYIPFQIFKRTLAGNFTRRVINKRKKKKKRTLLRISQRWFRQDNKMSLLWDVTYPHTLMNTLIGSGNVIEIFLAGAVLHLKSENVNLKRRCPL